MLREDMEVNWSHQARRSFEAIKHALIAPDYTKDFAIFSFASEDTIAAVLLQKNSDGLEQPIFFL